MTITAPEWFAELDDDERTQLKTYVEACKSRYEPGKLFEGLCATLMEDWSLEEDE